ncbi:hypothetical protein OQA88_7243 [Cercophora sp. LCS_1]
MVGLLDSADAVFRSFERRTPLRQQAAPALGVAVRTASAFARFDIYLASTLLRKRTEDRLESEFMNRVDETLGRIREDAIRGTPRSETEDINTVLERSKELEAICTQADDVPDTGPEDVTSSDFARSNLDARVVLGDKISNGLGSMLQGLVNQLHCCEGGHLLRLKLTGFHDTSAAKQKLSFDAYLSSRYTWKPPRWVQSRCTITRIDALAGTGCSVITSSEARNEELRFLLEDLRNHKSTTDSGKREDGASQIPRMVKLDACHPVTSPAIPTSSLFELLRTGGSYRGKQPSVRFRRPERERMCLNLALSLLHLSTSPWKRAYWGSYDKAAEGIFFLRDPATGSIIDRTHPYLSYRLHKSPPPQHDRRLLCDPRLLDFAKLIMEIQMWETIPIPPAQKRDPDAKGQLRRHLLDMINEPERFSGKDAMFKRAVEACLSAEGKEAASDEEDNDRLRNFLFAKIVRPLDHYALFPKFSAPTRAAQRPVTARADLDQMFDWRKGYSIAPDARARVESFTTKMDSFLDAHIRNIQPNDALPAHCNKRIRIAILDSGIASNDTILRAARRRKDIQDCRNFGPGLPTDCEDRVGHGTMVARLLMQMAPNAHIFIAKVTSGGEKHIPKDGLYRIAKAINWAVQVWKVDIINMSFALPQTNPDIDEAIKEALDPTNVCDIGATRKIIFAAAGNNQGGNTRRSWPASGDGVIAIHATDGMGMPVNTNPGSTNAFRFATLGSSIPYASFRENEDGDVERSALYISGTSFATPIAAGIAANVLEYARHYIDNLNERRKERLYSGPGMEKIFEAMSEGLRDDCHYVQPWTFWEERFRGGRWRGHDYPEDDPDNVAAALSYLISRV